MDKIAMVQAAIVVNKVVTVAGILALLTLWWIGFFEQLTKEHWAIIIVLAVTALFIGYYYGLFGYR